MKDFNEKQLLKNIKECKGFILKADHNHLRKSRSFIVFNQTSSLAFQYHQCVISDKFCEFVNIGLCQNTNEIYNEIRLENDKKIKKELLKIYNNYIKKIESEDNKRREKMHIKKIENIKGYLL